MSYLNITSASRNLEGHKGDLSSVIEKTKLSFLSLATTKSNFQDRSSEWIAILDSIKISIKSIENEIRKLQSVRLSESEKSLEEEIKKLIEEYTFLLRRFNEEKGKIIQQTKEKRPLANSFFPLAKEVKINQCYFCDQTIDNEFSYKLDEKEQIVLGIEIKEGAVFCSRECLLNYCKEYQNNEKFRKNEYRERQRRVEEEEDKVKKITSEKTEILRILNSLRRKKIGLENELERGYNPREKKEVGFWKKLAIKLNLSEENNPRSQLEKIEKKINYSKKELEEIEEKLREVLISLAVNKQGEKEYKEIEYRNNRSIKKNEEKE